MATAQQKYCGNCKCIDEDKSDVENEETTIREVVWSSFANSERKDWIDKEEKEKQKEVVF